MVALFLHFYSNKKTGLWQKFGTWSPPFFYSFFLCRVKTGVAQLHRHPFLVCTFTKKKQCVWAKVWYMGHLNRTLHTYSNFTEIDDDNTVLFCLWRGRGCDGVSTNQSINQAINQSINQSIKNWEGRESSLFWNCKKDIIYTLVQKKRSEGCGWCWEKIG